ncbi:MAG: DUF4097 family beta strand repeat-containing protein [Longimicrobiales bacterium]
MTRKPMRAGAALPYAGPLIALTLTSAPLPLLAQAERFALPGQEIAIYNIAGEVQIERGTGDAVEVLVSRGGSDAAQLRIATGQIDGRNTLRVIYPDDEVRYERRWGGNTSMRVRSDGTFGAGGRRVNVRSRGRGGLEAHADLRILIPDGRRVAVLLGVGGVEAANVVGDLVVDVAAAGVEVRGVRGALLVDTGSGSITVADVQGEVGIDTGSGSVEVSVIRGSRLRVDTGSGSVRGNDLTTDDLSVDTGSGRIELSAVSARRLVLDTGSGSIDLGLLSDVESARLDTGSGSVRLRVPAELGAELEIETGSGGIDVDVPVEVARMARNSFVGRIGDGVGRIVVDTGSGGVRLVRN